MVRVPENAIVSRGRLGPGEMIGVDLQEAKLYGNTELLDLLAARQDFSSWIKRTQKIGHIVRSDVTEPVYYEGEELRRRQLAVGSTLEELEAILHPMVSTASEAIGSMGDDTPLAVLSPRYRGLAHYFRQMFSQVTNPPIDSLRESRVMSLTTRLGNLGNILDQSPEQCDMLQLPSPVLTSGEYEGLRNFTGASGCVIDCTFPAKDGEAGLREAIARIRREAEEGVRGGCTTCS